GNAAAGKRASSASNSRASGAQDYHVPGGPAGRIAYREVRGRRCRAGRQRRPWRTRWFWRRGNSQRSRRKRWLKWTRWIPRLVRPWRTDHPDLRSASSAVSRSHSPAKIRWAKANHQGGTSRAALVIQTNPRGRFCFSIFGTLSLLALSVFTKVRLAFPITCDHGDHARLRRSPVSPWQIFRFASL